MAIPSVTNTFSNGTTADATQVNTNFTDLINALTDGTKSITVDAITAAGNVSFQGNVTLGNGSVDDLTISASLASTIPIKTNNSFDIGSATLGLAGVYLGAPSSRTTRVKSNQSIASSFTLTLPVSVGSAGQKAVTDGSGNLSFANSGPAQLDNYALSASVATNALTVALKDASGSDASASSPIYIVHRNATVTTGTPSTTTVTAAASIVVPASATLGHASAQNQYVYVYLIMGSATEIAVSGQKVFDESVLQNATAVTSGSTSGTVLYATSNHTSKPIRYLGRLKSNQTVAGTWAAAISEISLAHGEIDQSIRHSVILDTDAGFGSTNTRNRYFTNITTTGTALTGANSATNGATITVNEDGLYFVAWYGQRFAATVESFEITLNTVGYVTLPGVATVLAHADTSNANAHTSVCGLAYLRTGDVVRVATNTASTTATNGSGHSFRVTKVAA